MIFHSLTSKQRDDLDNYIEENDMSLDDAEDRLYNKEEVLEYISMIYRNEREEFILYAKKYNIASVFFMDIIIRDEESMNRYCINHLSYEKEIDNYFDIVSEDLYMLIYP
jgi:hypothetical protein